MRPWIEKLVQQAKIRDRNAAVYINGTLTTQSAYKKLTTEIAPRFKDRPAGFTRIEYLGRRRNDKAKVAMIEIIGNPVEEYDELDVSNGSNNNSFSSEERSDLVGRNHHGRHVHHHHIHHHPMSISHLPMHV